VYGEYPFVRPTVAELKGVRGALVYTGVVGRRDVGSLFTVDRGCSGEGERRLSEEPNIWSTAASSLSVSLSVSTSSET
jgi:hypothetical protein